MSTCTPQAVQLGLCDGGGDDELSIGDDWEGEPSQPAPEGPPRDPSADPPPGDGAPGPGEQPDGDPGAGDGEDGGWECLDPEQVELGGECTIDLPDDEPDTAPPPVHWSDVAVFAPDPTQPVIEPFGAAIARAPMNVAVSASAHTVAGELFGFPMAVTFTPELYSIDYGDGTVVDISGPAPSWDQLGQEQLTPTGTSHVYLERGTATVTVDVSYSAVVDFGGWGVYPVNGYIVTQGAGTSVRIYEKQSFLVDSTCEEDPSGPGC